MFELPKQMAAAAKKNKENNYVTTDLLVRGQFKDIIPRPGFFTPYYSLYDLRRTIRTPLIAPVICLSLAVKQCLSGVGSLYNFIIDFFTIHPKQARMSVENIGYSIVASVYFALSAVLDTLTSLIALVTRSLTSMGVGLGKGIQMIGAGVESLFSSAEPQPTM